MQAEVHGLCRRLVRLEHSSLRRKVTRIGALIFAYGHLQHRFPKRTDVPDAVPDFSSGLRYVLLLRQSSSDTLSNHSDDECNRVKDWITLAERVLRVDPAARDVRKC